MTKRSKSLKDVLDAMARDIAKGAQEDDAPLDQKVSAFNALRAYYALEKKHEKGEDEDDGEETMQDLASVIHGENGRARRRP